MKTDSLALASVLSSVFLLAISVATDPCDHYHSINEPKRSAAYRLQTGDIPICDRYLNTSVTSWHRFVSPAGGEMPTTEVPMNHCGTNYPVWMLGLHPELSDGIVNRTGCIPSHRSSCASQIPIRVKKCDGYFVYKLEIIRSCNKAYCAGNRLPCPANTTSSDGFGPNCTADICPDKTKPCRWLFYTDTKSIWGIKLNSTADQLGWPENFNTNVESHRIANTTRAVAVSSDPVEKKIYWSDVTVNSINRINFDGTNTETIISFDVEIVDGLLVEPLSRRLYFTDNTHDVIVRVKLDGTDREVLFNHNIDSPRALAADSTKDFLFWTDWGTNPRIERSTLSGAQRTTIVNTSIIWPNGLSIDVNTQRIYWIDAKLKIIESVDYQGNDRTVHLQHIASSPFGLVFVEGLLYWSDKRIRCIYMYDLINRAANRVMCSAKNSILGLAYYGAVPVPLTLVSNKKSWVLDEDILLSCFSSPITKIHWSKDGVELNNGSHTEIQEDVQDNFIPHQGRSNLTVNSAMLSDAGNYSCYTLSADSSVLTTRSINVIIIPIEPTATITPKTMIKYEGQTAKFTCQVTDLTSRGKLFWYRQLPDKQPTVLRIDVYEVELSDLKLPESVNQQVVEIWCEAINEVGRRTSERAKLTVLRKEKEYSQLCQDNSLEGVDWSATLEGKSDIKPCPGNATGEAVRRCIKQYEADAVWGTVNLTSCISKEFEDLLSEMDNFTTSTQSPEKAKNILDKLVGITSLPNTTDTGGKTQRIYGGDLKASLNILDTMVEYNSKTGGISDKQTSQVFMMSASNLLDTNNKETWSDVKETNPNVTNNLITSIDKYGLQVASALGNVTNSTIETNNLVIHLAIIPPENKQPFEFKHENNKVELPMSVFAASNRSVNVVNVVYNTMSDILEAIPLQTRSGDEMDKFVINSKVVSSTVEPRPLGELDPPITIIIYNLKETNQVNKHCVFLDTTVTGGQWSDLGCKVDYDLTNQKQTACKCNHMTSFASLLDVSAVKVSQKDKQALELISIIGCSLSIMGVSVTVVVTVLFWRLLKSPRSIVLINLCIAIGLANTIVILEQFYVNNEIACKVMAALLHYFLLAMFLWMLCEGVLLYTSLIIVFGDRAKNQVKYYFGVGWGIPALIVAIVLGATKTQGYGRDGVCWLTLDNYAIWAFAGPAAAIMFINLIIFVMILRQMLSTQRLQQEGNMERVRSGFKASAVVLPLLGVTWVFGLLTFSMETVIFKYLFAVLNSLQGFMIFLFNCVLNKQVKDTIKRRRTARSRSSENSLTRSTLLRTLKIGRSTKQTRKEALYQKHTLSSTGRKTSDNVFLSNESSTPLSQDTSTLSYENKSYETVRLTKLSETDQIA